MSIRMSEEELTQEIAQALFELSKHYHTPQDIVRLKEQIIYIENQREFVSWALSIDFFSRGDITVLLDVKPISLILIDFGFNQMKINVKNLKNWLNNNFDIKKIRESL